MADESPAELQIEPGQILAGKYRVEEEIGSGGMGIVVSARHVHDAGHRLAIKLLKGPRGQGSERSRRAVRARGARGRSAGSRATTSFG